MLAIVSPGQGSQTQKMLDNWLIDASVKDYVAKLSKLLNFDFIYFGTLAQQDEINLTQNTQPLLVLNSLISFDKLKLASRQLENTVFAGHSVGEIVSYCLSGIISKSEALEISILRGKSMSNQLISQNQTGMAAILGELNENLLNLIETFDLQIANRNSSQQIVVGGEIENINKLINTKPNGVRIIKLSVAAAFHTNFMANSLKLFQKSIESYNFKNPNAKIISNFDGLEITTGTDAFNKLIGQLTNSVRWDLCQKKFIELGVTGILELCPGGVLTGISKRENPNIETFSIKNPSDISSANEFIAKHA
jgi:[acyl-carrier-protein] S-malonyltransferase